MDHFIRLSMVENVRMIDRYNSRKPYVGNLFLTSSHLIFKDPENKKEVWLFYSHISNVEKLPLTTSGSPIMIRSKTFLSITLVIAKDRDAHDIYISLQQLSLPSDVEYLYCFHCKFVSENLPKSAGWNFFDLQSEYQRMQVPNEYWSLTTVNKDYELCDTYPQYLYVPASSSHVMLCESSKFRSKGRLPVLTYLHKNQAAICRCSQPLSGFNARCPEDEQLLTLILQSNPNSKYMYVVDTRPRINAMANRAAGKGYENENFYDNMKFQFFNIENIHVMRGSLTKLIESCDGKSSSSVATFLGGMEASGWLRHIKGLLDAAAFICQAVESGVSVVVHCSDGWDRTAQVCSLAGILLDPFYRTLQGFQALIEKDWLAFGHKFTDRYGFVAGDPKEISPVFTQFLEGTWQLTRQFPTHFQFNEHYLVDLHDNFASCQFGTFVGNSERERKRLGLSGRTFSFWGYAANKTADYLNPLYEFKEECLKPDLCSQNFRFWRSLYCRFDGGVHPRECLEDVMAATAEHTASMEDHINFLRKKISSFKRMLSTTKDKVIDVIDQNSGRISSSPRSQMVASGGGGDGGLGNDSSDLGGNASADAADSGGGDTVETKTNLSEELEKFTLGDEDERGMIDAVTAANTVALDWKPLSAAKRCVCLMPLEYPNKKIHCWKCGGVFCARCIHNKAVNLPGHTSKRTSSICKPCYLSMLGTSYEDHAS